MWGQLGQLIQGLEDPLEPWLRHVAGKLVLAVGWGPQLLSTWASPWVAGLQEQMSQETESGSCQFLKAWAPRSDIPLLLPCNTGQAVNTSRFKQKRSRAYLLMGGVSDHAGLVL